MVRNEQLLQDPPAIRADGGDAMQQSESALPMTCPRCHHREATLYVSAGNMLSVTCPKCGQQWATSYDVVPVEIKKTVQVILLNRALARHRYRV